ncbi:MAG: acyl-CoA dehydrogenase family protein [Longimicrobiales bacterium]|nr:acyl-CoA dehydrogenase family protein [Longimicrobiales bacterium]
MSADVLTAATSLGEQIRDARDQTEELRQIPDSVVRALAEADLFRLAIPSEHDGPEVDPVTALRVYESLARSEPSVAWAVWNSSLPCLFARFLDDSVRQELFGTPGGKYASSTRPSGRARRENGNFRISGHWSLVSGCLHADWIGLMCLVEEDGEIEMVEPDAPHVRMAFVPADSVEILDTWHVGGLRGTGSHDVVAEDLEVPAERTFAPMDPVRLYHPIGQMPITSTMAAGHAAICLGIACAALDSVIGLGRTKVSPDPVPKLPDRASNQQLVAEAGTLLSALRAEVHRAVGHNWGLATSGSEITAEDIADAFAAAVVAARESRQLVSSMYEVAGTPALYVDFPLERLHRDVHAAMQHLIVQRMWLEEVGRVRFGMEVESPLFLL